MPKNVIYCISVIKKLGTRIKSHYQCLISATSRKNITTLVNMNQVVYTCERDDNILWWVGNPSRTCLNKERSLLWNCNRVENKILPLHCTMLCAHPSNQHPLETRSLKDIRHNQSVAGYRRGTLNEPEYTTMSALWAEKGPSKCMRDAH